MPTDHKAQSSPRPHINLARDGGGDERRPVFLQPLNRRPHLRHQGVQLGGFSVTRRRTPPASWERPPGPQGQRSAGDTGQDAPRAILGPSFRQPTRREILFVVDSDMQPTMQSRHALSRARFFLDLARECPASKRVAFEAFLEASIVFARAAVHRFKAEHESHSRWNAIWDSWLAESAVVFFRKERDWILKEAPPRIGQKAFIYSVQRGQTPYEPSTAAEFYYFESPEIPATATVERHLVDLTALLEKARRDLSGK